MKNRSKKEQIHRYQDLVSLGKIANTATDFQNIEKKAGEKIKSIIRCEYVVLYSVDKETRELYADYTCSEDAKPIRHKIDDKTIIGECAHYNATLHLKDVSTNLGFARLKALVSGKDYKDALVAPMMVNGEVIGVIMGVNSTAGEFDAIDIELMEAVSNTMAVVFHNNNLLKDMKKQFYQLCEAMADAIGKKDRYTGGHTKRVSHFAEMIASEMDLSVAELQDLRLASVLHDVGKIGIEDKILKKEAPLTTEEFEIMKNHPKFGYEILGHIDSLKNVNDGMRYHHERPDGKGYPYGLKGDEIPTIASIVSCADTFDAMVSTRPYRKGLPPMVAYHEIRKHSGTQFNEEVVKAFVRSFKKTKMYKECDDEYLISKKKVA